jgi:hypothetical protein
LLKNVYENKSASAGAMLSVHAGLRLHGDYEAVRNFGLALPTLCRNAPGA